jgi:hypothetical protein
MDMAERLPSLTSEDLASLRSNAERLGRTGTPRQQEEADRLLPLIEAEVKGRKVEEGMSGPGPAELEPNGGIGVEEAPSWSADFRPKDLRL